MASLILVITSQGNELLPRATSDQQNQRDLATSREIKIQSEILVNT